jgi:hypothetical protein
MPDDLDRLPDPPLDLGPQRDRADAGAGGGEGRRGRNWFWISALVASVIYWAWLYWMFHEPMTPDSYRGLLFLLFTAPASILVLTVGSALHFDPPVIVLPVLNVLLVLSPFAVAAIIRNSKAD